MPTPPRRWLFVGDSVTDCGRARPVGTCDTGLGDGWVSLLQRRLERLDPPVRLLNQGVAGDTVRHLAARWERDVLAWQPELLVVGVGINDVWRRFDTPRDPGAHVPLDEFVRVYDRLLADPRPAPRLLLWTPFFVQPDRADPMRRLMDGYGAAVRDLAEAHRAACVDAQAVFDAACAMRPALEWAADRVHPSPDGHRLLAEAILEALVGTVEGGP